MVAHSQMLTPELGGHIHRKLCGESDVGHCLVHALSVHIQLHRASACRNPVENQFPELVAALLYSALPMNAEGNTANRGTCLKQSPNGVPAIHPMILLGQTFNGVVRIRAVDPFIAMHPETDVKLHPPGHCLLADKFQHLQILVALRSGQLWHAYLIAGYIYKERIGEQEVSVCNVADKI